jgi:hypothetical protein
MVDFLPHGAPPMNVDHPTGEWGVVWWNLPPYNAWRAVLDGWVSVADGMLVVHRLTSTPKTEH